MLLLSLMTHLSLKETQAPVSRGGGENKERRAFRKALARGLACEQGPGDEETTPLPVHHSEFFLLQPTLFLS